MPSHCIERKGKNNMIFPVDFEKISSYIVQMILRLILPQTFVLTGRGVSAFLILFCVLFACISAPSFAQNPMAIDEKGAFEIASAIREGKITSEAAVKAYLERIKSIDDNGPTLNAVIATMPDALAQARARDLEVRSGKALGPLHGVPILIKDNIETLGLPTTAGSLALAKNDTHRDAPVVARLRAAGAVILGKTNLSEWANIRSNTSTSGWSAVGGLTRNPHVLNRSACGSSSGSGAAVAARLSAAAIGTETDGSITCPAGTNGIVGFKPTLGLISRTHIVPIAHSQDTAGPMTLSVRDAALMMTVMAGSDPADTTTKEADARKADYVTPLNTASLKGVRMGVMRDRLGTTPALLTLFENALTLMRKAGAEIVDIKDTRAGLEGLGEAEFTVLMHELKADMATYLASLPKTVRHRTLADLIAFNKANATTELTWFDQSLFELAETKGKLDDPAYMSALERSRRLARDQGIDRLMRENKVQILVGITNGPAWAIDLVNGDQFAGPSVSQLPAVAGYPHLTVPMGTYKNLPIGISFIGGQWEDARVLSAGHAYEQLSRARVKPGFIPSLEMPSVSRMTRTKPIRVKKSGTAQ
jgi:amidase